MVWPMMMSGYCVIAVVLVVAELQNDLIKC